MRYLLLILFFCSTVQSAFINIIFTYQSQGCSLTVWVEWFTLCLAPVIAHVAGGVVPSTIIGSNPRSPSWTASLSHFNPVSILWRYYAIADRRLRARSWDERDLAACNAVFFDSDQGRFDGSEEIMVSSRAWIAKIPESKHVRLLSASLLTTIVLAVQGIQATFLIATNLMNDAEHKFLSGLPYIFVPIGCLGFLRLPAAPWLSSDFGYLPTWEMPSGQETLGSHDGSEKVVAIINSHMSIDCVGDRLHGPRSWRGVTFRTFWFLTVLLFMSGSAASATRNLWAVTPSIPYINLSRLLLDALWVSVTLGVLLIHIFYISIGRTNSTIVPCIHATWYKVYTAIVILLGITAFVISAAETRVLKSKLETTSLPEFDCKTVMGSWTCVPVNLGQGNYNV